MSESIHPEPIQEPVSVDDNSSTLSVDDGAGSLTVDNAALSVTGGGTESGAQRVTIASDSTGVVSVDDNGSSLTIDNAALSVTGGGTESGAQRVTIASDSTGVLSVDDNGSTLSVDDGGGNLSIDDGGNSITVDGTVTANQGSAGTAWEVVGDVASDAAVPGNPVTVGGRASTAIPTAVSADGDSVYNWLSRNGLQIVSAIPGAGLSGDPYTLTSKTVQTTTTQTGSDVVTPTSGKTLVVTSVQIQAGGTTAGTVQLWFGANADTTYSRGTDLAIFDGEFAPSATLKPGVVLNGPFIASAADHEVHLTTSAAINPLTVTVWYYER